MEIHSATMTQIKSFSSFLYAIAAHVIENKNKFLSRKSHQILISPTQFTVVILSKKG